MHDIAKTQVLVGVPFSFSEGDPQVVLSWSLVCGDCLRGLPGSLCCRSRGSCCRVFSLWSLRRLLLTACLSTCPFWGLLNALAFTASTRLNITSMCLSMYSGATGHVNSSSAPPQRRVGTSNGSRGLCLYSSLLNSVYLLEDFWLAQGRKTCK